MAAIYHMEISFFAIKSHRRVPFEWSWCQNIHFWLCRIRIYNSEITQKLPCTISQATEWMSMHSQGTLVTPLLWNSAWGSVSASYLDGVQIARDLNDTGWTIGLGVGHNYIFMSEPSCIPYRNVHHHTVIKVVKGQPLGLDTCRPTIQQDGKFN